MTAAKRPSTKRAVRWMRETRGVRRRRNREEA
jgi:hypothetical protein